MIATAPSPLDQVQAQLDEATRSFHEIRPGWHERPPCPEFRRRFARMVELRRRRDDLLAARRST